MYENETEVSKDGWSIVKCVPAYSAGGQSYNLCFEEKMTILKSNKKKTLNKRTGLFAKCHHKNRFSARNFKRARPRAHEMFVTGRL